MNKVTLLLAGLTAMACITCQQTIRHPEISKEVAEFKNTFGYSEGFPPTEYYKDWQHSFQKDESTFIQKISHLTDKRIEYFLNHPEISTEAKELYVGEAKIGRNTETLHVLNELNGLNDDLRPFYFHILNVACNQASEQTAPILGNAIMNFAGHFPKAFTYYLLSPDYKGRKKLVDDYVFLVNLELNKNPKKSDILDYLDSRSQNNCFNCTQEEVAFVGNFWDMLREN